MKVALKEANKAAKRNEVPVGAVLTDQSGKILSKNGNRVREMKDPTAHAELLVLRESSKLLNSDKLINCSIYTTLEPCAMCAMAISLARIKNLFYGAFDQKKGAVDNGPKIYASNSCQHKPNVFSGFYEKESEELLKIFFKESENRVGI